MDRDTSQWVAVIGMAGRFPGAADIDAFWENLLQGRESISFFSREQLEAAGESAALLDDPHYVPARAIVNDVELFDAAFFGFTPQDARMMDPQQRLLLTCAWQALEHAGYAPNRIESRIGLYAGVGRNDYLINHLLPSREKLGGVDESSVFVGNSPDFLATQIAYRLNLQGPSISVNTACSTSLVAVHEACKSLQCFECEMALAGGAAVKLPQVRGYLYREGGVNAPDGHCRAFDAEAGGSVGGNGAGIVLLKRYDDAIEDGDMIHAVIQGSAINNDGSDRIGFTAPSVSGQSQVISDALAMADAEPADITHIESHGTATRLGDVIEFEALNDIYGAADLPKGTIALTSLKTAIGHLDAAAGVAGLIKTVLALKHGVIPPSLNFKTPNPGIDFNNSPFFVNTKVKDWKGPRRAGLSSFGMGGTNVHMILTQADPIEKTHPASLQILPLSARSSKALADKAHDLGRFLQTKPDVDLADVAFTLQEGRQDFDVRGFVVSEQRDACIASLLRESGDGLMKGNLSSEAPKIGFLFPGQGSQHVNMGRELYESVPIFRETMEECARLVKPYLERDLLDLIYPGSDQEGANTQLKQTRYAQPAIFSVSYALAKMWHAWGVQPHAMSGHSIGEYVTACLAGVFSLEHALALVTARGALMQAQPEGAMVAAPTDEATVRNLLPEGCSLAAINAPDRCVVTGPFEAVDQFEHRLKELEITPTRLVTSHAFHSAMMDGALQPFALKLDDVNLQTPGIAFISNVTGEFISDTDAVDPAYWTRHLRETVYFGKGLETLREEGCTVFLEVGPGQALTQLARRMTGSALSLASTPRPGGGQGLHTAISSLGRLWLMGHEVVWEALPASRGGRTALPTYPFEAKRFWVDPGRNKESEVKTHEKKPLGTWLYQASWERDVALETSHSGTDDKVWVVFGESDSITDQIIRQLLKEGRQVRRIVTGPQFEEHPDDVCTINPDRSEDYERALDWAEQKVGTPNVILHLWGLYPSADKDLPTAITTFERMIYFLKAVTRGSNEQPKRIGVALRGLYDVLGGEATNPAHSGIAAPCLVINQEHPHIRCSLMDVGEGIRDELISNAVLGQLRRETFEPVSAFRGSYTWTPTFVQAARSSSPTRPKVWFITGGTGNVGLALARGLAGKGVSLALVSRTAFPAASEWNTYIQNKDGVTTLHKIEQIKEIRVAGSEVMTLQADVTDIDAIKTAVSETEASFGAIEGVIHAAGLVDPASFRPISHLTQDQWRAQFKPKPEGLLALQEALKHRPQARCISVSSIASVLGGLGHSAYAAANGLMEAYAKELVGPRWTSIAWDGWTFERGKESAQGPGQALSSTSMNPTEGVEVLERVLEGFQGLDCVYVSTIPIRDRWEHWAKAGGKNQQRNGSEEELATLEGVGYERPELSSNYEAPTNPVEEKIVRVWERLLGINGIGRHDNFFELGGDSLLATQLHGRLKKALSVDFPLDLLFDATTPALTAQAVVSLEKQPGLEVEHRITVVSRSEKLPLSFAQQRLWFLDQMEGVGSTYNLPTALKLLGTLNIQALQEALQELVNRHEGLRTNFGLDGEPYQIIHEKPVFEMPFIDYSHLGEHAGKEAADHFLTEDIRKPFALDRDLLIRTALLRLQPKRHILLINMHHIIIDGWSTGLIVKELMILYRAFINHQRSPLAPVKIQYVDFASWQRKRMTDPRMKELLNYWRNKLSGIEQAGQWPTDHPRPTEAVFRGDTLAFSLPESLAEALRARSRQEGQSLFVTVFSVFQLLQCRHTGLMDVFTGTDVANRNHPDVESMVGFFVNQLVMRNRFEQDMTIRDLFRRVGDTAAEAYTHQDLPFEALVAGLKIKRDPSKTPLFQVKFVLQNAPIPALELPDLEMELLRMDNQTAKFDLLVNMEDSIRGLCGAIQYREDLFTRKTIERIVEEFKMALTIVSQQPDIRLGALLANLELEDKEQRKEKSKKSKASRMSKLKKLKRAHGEIK